MCVCLCLDKTANPQATRTQYPVSQILISCVSVAERDRKKRKGGGPVAPETEDTAALFENVYGVLPISHSLSLSLSLAWPLPFSISPFIISDLIKQRRAACSAMKHLLAACNEIVEGEPR